MVVALIESGADFHGVEDANIIELPPVMVPEFDRACRREMR